MDSTRSIVVWPLYEALLRMLSSLGVDWGIVFSNDSRTNDALPALVALHPYDAWVRGLGLSPERRCQTC